MSANLQLIPGTFPDGYTPTTWQLLYNEMFIRGYALFPSNYALFNFGSTAPDAADRDKPWIRSIAGGEFDGLYVWSTTYGVWIRKHDIDYPSGVRWMWADSLANLVMFQRPATENAADPVAACTGPFWEEDENFRAVFPVGVGTLPSSTPIAEGGTGGEETHTLTIAEMPAHTHPPLAPPTTFYGNAVVGATYNIESGSDTGASATTGSTGGDGAHNNLPPYRGIYLIKRTARLYYIA